mgnify:CR=1 FL=1
MYLVKVSSQTKANLFAGVLLDVGGKVDRLPIFYEDFAKLTGSHFINLFQELGHVDVLELAGYHLRGKVRLVENPIVIDAHWHDLDIVF